MVWNVECVKCWNKFTRKSGSRGKVCPECRKLINKLSGLSNHGTKKIWLRSIIARLCDG